MFASISASVILAFFGIGHHAKPIDNFSAHAPFHIHTHSNTGPTGLSPSQIRQVYNLPTAGGTGKTIAIVDAYNSNTIASDLTTFSSKFSLPACTTANGCFQKVQMSSRTSSNSGWALEESLDVEWAHAIAPQAKIMLVEARSASGNDLLSAVTYAANQPGVVAVSMSWGGPEFAGESAYDQDFTSNHGVQFFASAGDSGSGADWPAVSQNVIGVGGTSLKPPYTNSATETAWADSGGGISAFEPIPSYQLNYGLSTGGYRATPDVSYDADPASGFAVYDSTWYDGQVGWFQVGGTSAGAPQWAAIQADGGTVSANQLYTDAASPSYGTYFRDITSGTNGKCGADCTATTGYDLITGLGSPLTTHF